MTEKHLLFAVLAFESDLIDLAQLAAVCRAWVADKSKPIADLLVNRGWITAEDRGFVEKQLERKLAKHQHDPRVTLNSVVRGDVCDAIKQIDDPDIQQSLSSWPSSGPVLIETIGETQIESGEPKSRYTWISEVGKGGLGKVWLARDNDLAREVALKEIRPDKASVSTEAVRRLIKEAQITGQLQHPNIVPVYEVNRGGRPFYTMKLVKGETLSKAIRRHHEQRRTGPADPLSVPRLLNIFANVCEALAYAHSRGIIHRDLKPENIVLGDYGEAIVLDWGLAKQIGSADEETAPVVLTEDAQSQATRPGATPGTPAYMSPEQAAGRVDLIDNRTDVYGLGAILFEILTGHAPHRSPVVEASRVSSDAKLVGHKSLAALLQRIANGDTPRARSTDPSIPSELDAVCAKAMSKRRDDRYPDAKGLVADVRRFLSDEPVSASPEPFIIHARRWVKRHPTVVVGTAATVLISLVSFAAIASVVGQSNRLLAAKNTELEQANQRERDATSLAKQSAAVAREQSQLALKSLESVILDIQRKLRNVPGARDLQRSLLQTALARLQEVSDQFASRGEIDRNTMIALIDLGDVFLRFGSGTPGGVDSDGPLTAARKVFQKAFDIAEKLAAADPSDAHAQRDLSVSYGRLGNVQLQSGQVSEALRSYQQELVISQVLAAAFPSNAELQRDLSGSYSRLGDAQRQSGQVTAALGSFQKLLDISQKLAAVDPSDAQAQRDLSISYSHLGDVLLRSGQVTEALASYQKALEISQKLAAAAPSDAEAQRGLSISYSEFGDVQRKSGQVAEAVVSYQKFLEISQKLAAADSSDFQAQRALCLSYNKLGQVWFQSEQLAEAIESYQKGLAISQKLAAADPNDAVVQHDLHISYTHLGDVLRVSGKATESLEIYLKGLEIALRLATADPNNVTAQRDLFISYSHLGDVLLQSGQVTEALGPYLKALEINRKLTAFDPSDSLAQRDLSILYKKLGNAQLQSAMLTEAMGSYQKALAICKKLAAADPSDAAAQRGLSISYENLGDAQLRSGQVTEALGSYQKGLEVSLKLATAAPSDVQAQRDPLSLYDKLGNVLLQSGEVTEALELYRKGLKIHEKLAAADPSDAEFQRELSNVYLKLGDVLNQTGQVTEALKYFNLSVEISEKLVTADPSDAQAQGELAVTFLIIGSVEQKQKKYARALESYGRGLKFLQSSKEQKRLAPANEKRIGVLEKAIAECKEEMANEK